MAPTATTTTTMPLVVFLIATTLSSTIGDFTSKEKKTTPLKDCLGLDTAQVGNDQKSKYKAYFDQYKRLEELLKELDETKIQGLISHCLTSKNSPPTEPLTQKIAKIDKDRQCLADFRKNVTSEDLYYQGVRYLISKAGELLKDKGFYQNQMVQDEQLRLRKTCMSFTVTPADPAEKIYTAAWNAYKCVEQFQKNTTLTQPFIDEIFTYLKNQGRSVIKQCLTSLDTPVNSTQFTKNIACLDAFKERLNLNELYFGGVTYLITMRGNLLIAQKTYEDQLIRDEKQRLQNTCMNLCLLPDDSVERIYTVVWHAYKCVQEFQKNTKLDSNYMNGILTYLEGQARAQLKQCLTSLDSPPAGNVTQKNAMFKKDIACVEKFRENLNLGELYYLGNFYLINKRGELLLAQQQYNDQATVAEKQRLHKECLAFNVQQGDSNAKIYTEIWEAYKCVETFQWSTTLTADYINQKFDELEELSRDQISNCLTSLSTSQNDNSTQKLAQFKKDLDCLESFRDSLNLDILYARGHSYLITTRGNVQIALKNYRDGLGEKRRLNEQCLSYTVTIQDTEERVKVLYSEAIKCVEKFRETSETLSGDYFDWILKHLRESLQSMKDNDA